MYRFFMVLFGSTLYTKCLSSSLQIAVFGISTTVDPLKPLIATLTFVPSAKGVLSFKFHSIVMV
jgi:hypothetical protein